MYKEHVLQKFRNHLNGEGKSNLILFSRINWGEKLFFRLNVLITKGSRIRFLMKQWENSKTIQTTTRVKADWQRYFVWLSPVLYQGKDCPFN